MLNKLLVRFFFLIMFVLLQLAPTSIYAEPSQELFNAPESEGNKHVKAELVFDRESIPLGVDRVRIGVLLTIEPGWHIYWKNPGEAGKPTEVHWQLPESWRASPLNWPVPIRMVERGDIMTFAYSNQVLLYSELEPPPIVPEGDQTLTFSAEVSWLVCLDRCVPGKAVVQREISLSSVRAETPSKEIELFSNFEKRVPTPVQIDELRVKNNTNIYFEKANANSGTLHFLIKSRPEADVPALNAQFFESRDFISAAAPEIVKTDDALIQRTVLTDLNDNVPLKGVLAIKYQDGLEKFLEIEAPFSKFDSDVSGTGFGDRQFKPSNYLFDSYELHEGTSGEVALPIQSTRSESDSNSLIFALLSAFLGGIILNLMPCVLPILSIKVMGIVSAKDKSSSENLVDSFWYLLGILITFVVVAIVAISLKASGSLLGWGFQFQYPGFVFSLIVILFILSLGFFDLYVAELPFLGVLTKVSNTQSMQHSRSKHIMDGILISTLSTPCTAPFLGTALVFAFSQSAISMVLIFLFIGLGLAFPYIVIVSRPSLMRFFPRPGNWMNRIKQLMGFGLLGTIIWLLFVMGNILENSTIPILVFLLALYLFFWFWAWSKEVVSTTSRIMLLTLAVAAPIISLWYAPPLGEMAREQGEADEIEWIAYSAELVQNSKQPVFIDFTADWCITCKYNENFILSKASIVAEFKKNNVLALKADWTKGDEDITEALNYYGGQGVPHYVYVQPQSEPQILPTILTEGLVLDLFARGGGG